MVYQATLQNLYYCYCNTDGIGFGADPHFGLFIDKSLTSGSSHACRTYENEPLSYNEHFTIKKLEVFSFNYNTD